MKFHFTLQILLLLFVYGCASADETAEQKGLKRLEEQAAWESVHSAMKDRCLGYGFNLGTDAYASCIMKLDDEVRNNLAKLQKEQALRQKCLRYLVSSNYEKNEYNRCMEGVAPSPRKKLTCEPPKNGEMSCREK